MSTRKKPGQVIFENKKYVDKYILLYYYGYIYIMPTFF